MKRLKGNTLTVLSFPQSAVAAVPQNSAAPSILREMKSTTPPQGSVALPIPAEKKSLEEEIDTCTVVAKTNHFTFFFFFFFLMLLLSMLSRKDE